jgi:hypothetical protein
LLRYATRLSGNQPIPIIKIDQLKQLHGPRVAAHLLYHAALSLTHEADNAAMAEAATRHNEQ